MISTSNLANLNSPEKLRQWMQTVVKFEDRFDSPYRYYSFVEQQSRYGLNCSVAYMDNGSGDSWSLVFNPEGAFLHGLSHESEIDYSADSQAWQDLLLKLPTHVSDYLQIYLETNNLSPKYITYVIYWDETTKTWISPKLGDKQDLSSDFLKILDCQPQTLFDFAIDYYFDGEVEDADFTLDDIV